MVGKDSKVSGRGWGIGGRTLIELDPDSIPGLSQGRQPGKVTCLTLAFPANSYSLRQM